MTAAIAIRVESHSNSVAHAMVRPLVSYDDITSSQEKNEGSPVAQPASRQKASKKRKRSAQTSQPHWDENPEPRQASIIYDQQLETSVTMNADNAEEEDGEGFDDEESRELTHNEIWDDSALIDAWNAAMEEYKAYHGDSEDWKKEATVKSPLWYNVPVPPSSTRKKKKIGQPSIHSGTEPGLSEYIPNDVDIADAEGNSRPSDFNTFVPSHDPSLRRACSDHVDAGRKPAPPSASHFTSQLVTRDEAFNRALEAMYWSGYWTAAYHYTTADNHLDVSNGADDTLHENDSQEEDDMTDG